MTGIIFILYFGSKNVLGTGWKSWDIAAFTTFLACFIKLSEMCIRDRYSNVNNYSKYLQEKYHYVNTGTTSMQGVPTTVSVSSAFLQKCMNCLLYTSRCV